MLSKDYFTPPRYFMLTPRDLEDWDASAEAFHHEQDLAQWKDKLRPCAEGLYITLFENFRDVRNSESLKAC